MLQLFLQACYFWGIAVLKMHSSRTGVRIVARTSRPPEHRVSISEEHRPSCVEERCRSKGVLPND